MTTAVVTQTVHAAPTTRPVPRSSPASPRSTKPTAPKTADCTNLGTGQHYPCTQAEYDAINEADEPAYLNPTKAQCHEKSEPASLEICNALGFPYGMTLSEMRAYDLAHGSNCSNGTQLYLNEHSCHVVSRAAHATTWSDGSVSRF